MEDIVLEIHSGAHAAQRPWRLGQIAQCLDIALGRTLSPTWVRVRAWGALVAGVAILLVLVWIPWFSWPVSIRLGESKEATKQEGASAAGRSSELAAARQELEIPEDPVPLSGLNRTQLFQRQQLNRTPAMGRNVNLAELSKGLQVQAILKGATPRAMIMDRSTNQIYQVGAGQFIGEIEIQEIRSTSVVVKWKEETLEISM